MLSLQKIFQKLDKQIYNFDAILKTNIFSEEEMDDYEYHQYYRSISFDQLKQIIYTLQQCSLIDEYAFADAIMALDIKLNNIVSYFKYVYEMLHKFFMKRPSLLKCFIKARHYSYTEAIQKKYEMDLFSKILSNICECLYRIDAFSGHKSFSEDHQERNQKSIQRVIISCNAMESALMSMEKYQNKQQTYDDIVVLYINLRNVMEYFEQLYDDVRTIIKNYPLSERFIRDNS